VKEAIKILKFRCFSNKSLMACLGTTVSVIALLSNQVLATDIKTANPDLMIRFDNTLTYSTMYRLSDQDADLIANLNADDGDRNFDKGVVMNRMDLLSLFDISYKKFGVAFSGAAWYDTIYNKTNDNDSPVTVNHDITEVAYNDFVDETVKWHGKGAELLEAMTFGTVPMGNMAFRYRAGQFSQWWGDSFFLGWNGVAGALAPVNVAKAATLPSVQLKELIMPIPQVAGSLQVTDNLSFAGYYQFKWKPARLFGTGSYFSPADLIGPGADRIMPWPGVNFIRDENKGEPDDSGQFGVNAKLETMFATFGAYYNKFHSKDFMVVTGGTQMQTPPGAPPFIKIPLPAYYYFYYPKDIESYAVSANKAVGQYTFALEVAYRKDVPLQTDSDDLRGLGLHLLSDPADSSEPLYAKGNTLNITVNTFSGGMKGNFFCDSQDLIAEIAYVKQMDVNNETWLNPLYEETGLSGTVHYTPKWYQVLPGLDLSLPLIVSYGFQGKPTSVIWGGSPEKGGDFVVGLYGLYNQVWEFELDYRNFFGTTDKAVGNQAHADRDYVSFFIRRMF